MVEENGFRQEFVVGWGDVDANGHMANVAYLDACVDTRFGYFASRGLSAGDVFRLGVGPVIRRDEVDYHRELRFQDRFSVDQALAGISDDGSRFRIRNDIRRGDGELAARVVTTGGWLDLAARRLVPAPRPILDALLALPRTEDFEKLPSSTR